MSNQLVSPDTKIDLTNCDREPIHILGHVQQFGCLIAVNSDWLVQHVSANVTDHLGLDAEAMIGEPLTGFFTESGIHEIRTRMQQLDSPDAVERLFGIVLVQGSDQRFNVALHFSGSSIILDVEPQRLGEARDLERGLRQLEGDHLGGLVEVKLREVLFGRRWHFVERVGGISGALEARRWFLLEELAQPSLDGCRSGKGW